MFLVARDERWKGRGGGHAEKGRERREGEKGGRERRERKGGREGRERREGEKGGREGRERKEGEKGGREGRERREEHDNCLLPHHHSPLCRTTAYPVQDGWNGVEELVFLEVFKT